MLTREQNELRDKLEVAVLNGATAALQAILFPNGAMGGAPKPDDVNAALKDGLFINQAIDNKDDKLLAVLLDYLQNNCGYSLRFQKSDKRDRHTIALSDGIIDIQSQAVDKDTMVKINENLQLLKQIDAIFESTDKTGRNLNEQVSQLNFAYFDLELFKIRNIAYIKPDNEDDRRKAYLILNACIKSNLLSTPDKMAAEQIMNNMQYWKGQETQTVEQLAKGITTAQSLKQEISSEQITLNKKIVKAISENDNVGLEEILNPGDILSKAEANDLIHAIMGYHMDGAVTRTEHGVRTFMAHGQPRICPLSMAIHEKNHEGLAVMLKFMESQGISAHFDEKLLQYSLIGEGTKTFSFPEGGYTLAKMDEAFADRVEGELEFLYDAADELTQTLDEIFGVDLNESLVGNLPKIEFRFFDPNLFQEKYLKTADSIEKRLVAYRILDAYAKAPEASEGGKKWAKNCMERMQYSHTKRNNTTSEKLGNYLDHTSQLGKLVLHGDKEKIAKMMFNSDKAAGKIDTAAIPNFINDNVSLEVQLALYEIAGKHNAKVDAENNKSRFAKVKDGIVNFFKVLVSPVVNDKKLDKQMQSVAEEVRKSYSLKDKGAKNMAEILRHNEPSATNYYETINANQYDVLKGEAIHRLRIMFNSYVSPREGQNFPDKSVVGDLKHTSITDAQLVEVIQLLSSRVKGQDKDELNNLRAIIAPKVILGEIASYYIGVNKLETTNPDTKEVIDILLKSDIVPDKIKNTVKMLGSVIAGSDKAASVAQDNVKANSVNVSNHSGSLDDASDELDLGSIPDEFFGGAKKKPKAEMEMAAEEEISAPAVGKQKFTLHNPVEDIDLDNLFTLPEPEKSKSYLQRIFNSLMQRTTHQVDLSHNHSAKQSEKQVNEPAPQSKSMRARFTEAAAGLFSRSGAKKDAEKPAHQAPRSGSMVVDIIDKLETIYKNAGGKGDFGKKLFIETASKSPDKEAYMTRLIDTMLKSKQIHISEQDKQELMTFKEKLSGKGAASQSFSSKKPLSRYTELPEKAQPAFKASDFTMEPKAKSSSSSSVAASNAPSKGELGAALANVATICSGFDRRTNFNMLNSDPKQVAQNIIDAVNKEADRINSGEISDHSARELQNAKRTASAFLVGVSQLKATGMSSHSSSVAATPPALPTTKPTPKPHIVIKDNKPSEQVAAGEKPAEKQLTDAQQRTQDKTRQDAFRNIEGICTRFNAKGWASVELPAHINSKNITKDEVAKEFLEKLGDFKASVNVSKDERNSSSVQFSALLKQEDILVKSLVGITTGQSR
jgi:hypothetical protein